MQIENVFTQLIEQATAFAKTDEGFRTAIRQFVTTVWEEAAEEVAEPDEGVVVSVPDQKDSDGDNEITPTDECDHVKQASSRTDQFECVEPKTECEESPRQIASNWTTPSDGELAKVEGRCRLKAEGSRWAAERKRLMSNDAEFDFDIAPDDHSLIQRAKDAECFLWMNGARALLPDDLNLLDRLGDCYEAVADALSLMIEMLDARCHEGEFFKSGLELLAEAQSALRVAVITVSKHDRVDEDQKRTFQWLFRQTKKLKLKIEHHMSKDDTADPSNSEHLRRRVAELRVQVEAAIKRKNKQRKLLRKLKYVSGKIQADPAQFDQQLTTLIRTLDDLVAENVPPSNIEIREQVVSFVDKIETMPDLPQNVDLVIREVHRFQDKIAPEADERLSAKPTSEVKEVAVDLAGRSIVVLGGPLSNDAIERLRLAFSLKEIYLPCDSKGYSYKVARHAIARDDVALVLNLIRRTSHELKQAKRYCEQHDKLYISLPAGHHPNQVAVQILDQCGDKLRKKFRRSQ